MNRFFLKLSYSPRKHIPELDGVRGLAILLVMLYHCFPGYLTGIGWVGVDLFFVLSGFLITGILLDTKRGNRYYINFIGRRILRIFPLYYLVLFVIFIIIPLLGKENLPQDFMFYIQHQKWFWSYLQNWWYSFHGFPQSLLLAHFWSLGVEEQFYLVWPLVILLVPNRFLLKLSILICAAAFIYRLLPLEWLPFSIQYRYVNTFSRMDALVIGAIIAQLIRTRIKTLEKIAIPVGMAGLVIFLVDVVITGKQSFLYIPASYTAIDLFMGMVLLLSFSQIKRVKNILRHPLMTFLGKYSYGLYVYHYIIYISLIYLIRHTSIVHFTSYIQRVLVVGITTVILAIVVSFLSYHLFEVHFLKLKSYFRSDSGKIMDKNKASLPIKVSNQIS